MDISVLSDQLGRYGGMNKNLPPVASWDPELSGDIDIVINNDGNWFHEGEEIKRDKLKRLFSTILKKEKDDYYLVTPVEKWRVQVEDLPFVVVLCDVTHKPEGIQVTLLTSVGDEVQLSADRCIELDLNKVPRVEIRDGLYARLNRNVYYRLAELVSEESGGQFAFIANGGRHRIG